MNDSDAIRLCRNGTTEAFRHVVERHQGQAINHAAAIVGHLEDAQDVVQEAFIDAYRALNEFDCARQFYPWFYTLLRNRCYKRLQSRRRDAQAMAALALIQERGTQASGENELDTALRRLGAEDRELILLKHLDGLTYAELAERLGIPAGTVMSRLYAARLRLRDFIAAGAVHAGKDRSTV